MSETAPGVTPNCCKRWPLILHHLQWMQYADFPHILTMAHLTGSGNKWFVNYCPSCGADRRNATITTEMLADAQAGD